MEQGHKIILHQAVSQFPLNIIIDWDGHISEHKIIHSLDEMKLLLEDVKLYNSENLDKKRIISI